jgi:hypothetical protein
MQQMNVWSRLAVDPSAGLKNLDPFVLLTKDGSPSRGEG